MKKSAFLIILFMPMLMYTYENIIFDLGGVLIRASNSQALWDLGPRKILNYSYYRHNPMTIRSKFYSFLNEIYPPEDKPYLIYDPQGYIVPQLMADWFKGTINSWKALDIITKELETNQALDEGQKGIYHQLAYIIFDPEQHVRNKRLIYSTVQFAKKAKKRGYKMYIVSNWDDATFLRLKEEFPDLFDLFDGILISAEVHAAKPDPKIYELALSRFNIDPKKTVFIDDQPANLEPADTLGMHTIHYTGRKLRHFKYYPITDKALERLQ